MTDLHTPVNALCPRVEIVICVVVLALACLEKNNKNNQKEDEHSGVLVSWRLTTLVKLSVDVSDVVSHKVSRKDLQ